jgi:hypothetical protein
MRILIVHQYYLMPGQPGGSRFNEMARLWAEQGHQVTVIAGTIDYASGKVPQRYHGRWVSKENDGAVLVYRCHVPATYATSYVGRPRRPLSEFPRPTSLSPPRRHLLLRSPAGSQPGSLGTPYHGSLRFAICGQRAPSQLES